MTALRSIPPFVIYLGLATAAGAQIPELTFRPKQPSLTLDDFQRSVEPLIAQQLEQRNIAGATVVVVHEGRVLLERGYGVADVATGRLMTPDTVVRLASITKLFTAIAVMQLVDRGRLELDRAVEAYLDFSIPTPRGGVPVTLRRLLSHRAGFENTVKDIGALSGPRAPLGVYLPNHLPRRIFPAGDVVAYSNFGFAVAAYIVERASGVPYERYVAENIFRPLGMESTTAEQPLPSRFSAVLSSGYFQADRAPTAFSMASPTIHEVGSTGACAAGRDMGRFIASILDPSDQRLGLSADSRAAMLSPQTGPLFHGYIGLGFYEPVAAENLGRTLPGHGGGTGGFRNLVALQPDQRFGLFISYNTAGVQANSAEDELLRRIVERYLPLSPSPPPRAGRATRQQPPRDGRERTYRDGVYQPTRRSESNVFKLVTLAQQVRLTGAATGGSVKPVLISTPVNIYSAVNQYSRVSWWERADVILPMLGVCLVYAMLSTLAWILAALWRVVGRRRPTGRRRLIDIVGDGELVLVSQLVAIVAAIWLVTAGAPYAAVASRAATAVTLGVSVTSWLGVLAVPLVVRGAFLGWRHASSSRRRRVQHSLTATVATALAAFSLYWRVAGL